MARPSLKFSLMQKRVNLRQGNNGKDGKVHISVSPAVEFAGDKKSRMPIEITEQNRHFFIGELKKLAASSAKEPKVVPVERMRSNAAGKTVWFKRRFISTQQKRSILVPKAETGLRNLLMEEARKSYWYHQQYFKDSKVPNLAERALAYLRSPRYKSTRRQAKAISESHYSMVKWLASDKYLFSDPVRLALLLKGISRRAGSHPFAAKGDGLVQHFLWVVRKEAFPSEEIPGTRKKPPFPGIMAETLKEAESLYKTNFMPKKIETPEIGVQYRGMTRNSQYLKFDIFPKP